MLIAGLADDSASWDAQVTALSQGFRVTVFDNRRMGALTDGPRRCPARLDKPYLFDASAVHAASHLQHLTAIGGSS